MTLLGGSGGPLGVGLNLDGTLADVHGTVQGCEVHSHDPITDQVTTAYAISSKAASLNVEYSHLVSGATNGSISPSSATLFLCTAEATVTDSLLETADPGAGHGQIALEYANATCGSPPFIPSLNVIRSRLWAHGTGASNTAFRLGSAMVTPRFESSALLAPAGNVMVVNASAAGNYAANFFGCTLNGTGTGGRAVNVVTANLLTLGLTDTLIVAAVPITLSGPPGQLFIDAGGANILHGSTTTLVAYNTSSFDITGYRANYGDGNADDLDPLLQSDGIHLGPGSPAAEHTNSTTCSTANDIDGENRPKGVYCDTGADEQ
jgi:hypothetical protein